MQNSMFDAADIMIDRQPVFGAWVDHAVRVAACKAREIPGRFHKSIEGIGFPARRFAAGRASRMGESRMRNQRRLRAIQHYVPGQFHRQILFRDRNRAAVVAINNRNRRTPVTLAGNAPVAQSEISFALTFLVFFQRFRNSCKSLFRGQAVKRAGIFQHTFYRVSLLRTIIVSAVFSENHLLDRNAVLLRKLKITLVMGRNRHHSAGAVAHQHKIGYPYRHLFAGDGMNRFDAGIDAAFFHGFHRRFGRFHHLAVINECADLGIAFRGF